MPQWAQIVVAIVAMLLFFGCLWAAIYRYAGTRYTPAELVPGHKRRTERRRLLDAYDEQTKEAQRRRVNALRPEDTEFLVNAGWNRHYR